MFVKFVPLHKGEVKHVTIQVEQEEKVTTLKDKLKEQFKAEHFKILFHGRNLHDADQTLTFYKMNPSSTIHVIEVNPPQSTEIEKKAPSEDELQQFRIAFELAIRKDKGQPFMKVMHRLGKRENLENIAATCPDITKDPIARAFLSKPELIYSLFDPDTLKYVYEKHPSICEAVYQLLAAIHEEKSTSKNSSDDLDVPMGPFAYSMDDSDDDDEDMETEEANRYAVNRGRRSLPGNPITADQLASALAAVQSATGAMQGNSPGGMGGMTGFTSQRPPTSSSGLSMPSASSFFNNSRPSSSRGGGITQDQLNAALAIALGESLSTPAPPTSTSGSNPTSGFAIPTQPQANFSDQLATMREVGITDMNMATRALQTMGGDVQAAIDLIFSGWNGELDTDDNPN